MSNSLWQGRTEKKEGGPDWGGGAIIEENKFFCEILNKVSHKAVGGEGPAPPPLPTPVICETRNWGLEEIVYRNAPALDYIIILEKVCDAVKGAREEEAPHQQDGQHQVGHRGR